MDAIHRLSQYAGPPATPLDAITRIDVIGYHADGTVAGLRSFTLEEFARLGSPLLQRRDIAK